MSDRKIQVELTEVEARALAGDGSNADWTTGAEKIRAALPPEYPEGTVAWVTTHAGVRHICIMDDDGCWQVGGGAQHLTAREVEPLRVLADDEAAVDAEVLASLASMWLQSANTRADITARYGPLAHRLDQITVDAEATS